MVVVSGCGCGSCNGCEWLWWWLVVEVVMVVSGCGGGWLY